ncbi:tannase and feruloyl esterase [Colletotrichum musicola]|uniref:Carboxylic ester hydrolase n=1 Tax=Colletotrichum musicola TaxID=2175873 RepID=A0A8H6JZX9_9PEZI|nr:tannase and feruloyl esterase [Colletotrichum musicola]
MRRLAAVLPALLRAVAAADSKAPAGQPCAPQTFRFPKLPGADFLSVTAVAVTDFDFGTPQTPEGRAAIPRSGVSFCNVSLTYVHTGFDDRTQVQIWLPRREAWNGRFVGVGGGGYSAGQFGSEKVVATLAQGYANGNDLKASSTDAGHDHTTWEEAPWALKPDGTINERLLTNYAHVAVHDMTIIAKDVVAQYYDKAPAYSYWSGCSTGGRQGIIEAQRYPGDYDGILSGAPAVNQPSLIISTYWPQFVMNRMGVYPHICEMIMMTQLAVDACDELDGVRDDVIADPDKCNFNPASVVGRELDCGGGRKMRMSAAAAEVAGEIWRGPHGAEGKPLWLEKGYPIGAPFTGRFGLGNVNCSVAGEPCKGHPFKMSVEWIRNLVHKDPDYNVTGMRLEDLEAAFDQSRREYEGLIGANDPDLSDFKRLGGKMISWHGLADECVTMRTSRDYYDKVLEKDQGAPRYYRHFEAPGVYHCYGLNGTFYPLKGLETLRAWVEEGEFPQMLDGFKVSGGNESEAPTRPLCAYPSAVKFKGGDPEKRESWGCEQDAAGWYSTWGRDEL